MIEVEQVNRVSLIRMARGKVNAMNLEFCERMIETLDLVESSDSNAAVLLGNDRVFSAGVDLREVVDRDDDYLAEFLPSLSRCFRRVFEFPKPLVAAIGGHAIAGGCILATACDLRLISNEAKIGLPELRIGVPLPSAAIEIMRFSVSPQALRSMVNVGKTFQGEEAVSVGLADRVVETAELLSESIQAAEGLTIVPPNVYRLSKQQQRAPAVRNMELNEAEFESQVQSIWRTPENRRVVQQYVKDRL